MIMKKKIVSIISKVTILMVAVAFIAACSDGAHKSRVAPPQPSTSLGAVTVKVSKMDAEGKWSRPSRSVGIQEGEKVKIQWEVVLTDATQVVDVVQPKELLLRAAEDGEEAPTKEDDKSKDKAPDEETAPAELDPDLKVTLESKALGISEEIKTYSGEKIVENVTTEAEIKLTALYKDGDPKVATATIKFAAPETPLEVTFTANPEEVMYGGSVDLCWTISREDAAFNIIDSNSNELVSNNKRIVSEEEVATDEEAPEAEEEAEGDPEDEAAEKEAADEAAEYVTDEETTTEEDASEEDASEVVLLDPTEGCITVSNLTDDVSYYLEVYPTGGEGKQTATVEVTVVKNLQVVSFAPSKDKITEPEDITLTWEVTPYEAVVTLNMSEEEFGSTGSYTVNGVKSTTTFTLTASFAGETVTAETTVTLDKVVLHLKPMINGKIVTLATGEEVVEAGTYFEGEEVTVSVDAEVEGADVDKSTIQVKLEGDDKVYAPNEEIKFTVTDKSSYEITATGENVEPTKVQVRANVRKWVTATDTIAEGAQVSAVVAKPDVVNSAFIGYRADLSETGDLYLGKVSSSSDAMSHTLVTLPYQAKLADQSWAGSFNKKMLRKLNTFPVNTISFVEGKMFAGVPGGAVYSEDNGATWKVLSLRGLIPNNKGNYPGQHKGCKGYMMDGWKNLEVAGFMDICDITVDDDGVFYMATSSYLVSLQNGLAAYLEDRSSAENGWAGTPPEGVKGELTYGTVNHDIETVNGKVFSASDKGLLVSEDKGIHWNQGGISDSVYSVKADKENDKLYVGGSTVMYECDLNGDNCDTLPGINGPIYDVNVGIGALFAATGNGIKLSRNMGQKWVDVTKGTMQGAGKIEQIAINKVDDTEGIFVATNIGAFASVAEVKVSSDCENPPCDTPEDEDEVEEPEEEAEEPEEETEEEDGEVEDTIDVMRTLADE